MEKLNLQKREITGKKVKHLKKDGLVPAVVYNSKGDSTNVSVTKSDADWLYRNATSTTILDTVIGKEEYKTLVKEFGINSKTGIITHVSLFQIDENAPMVFTIPFTLVGISPAVKNNLGVLVNVLDSIDVKCQLSKLQADIEIDISGLEHTGQTINVSDIKLPEGMTLINEDLRNAAIVTITEAQKVEEVVVAPVEGEVVEGEAVEGAEGETTTETPKE
ncbi:MAG: 50S ribosomal protein L25, large subunit ribosomal protein L25 [candidate division WS6 bacterium GW2011_GWC1_33_20]|uniref:Large ribosomal subunit protein bL25 n=2 Tax=Candidatus Dojkabacteria TaxID=74243 RepID=A0A0G0AFE7_9BACT|nr:MAG: 50S ribosomal protein L25, large subunit ribosomal protein L25 [candidate division WS6 bacterium GW2011_GWE2_33_157]KKP44027.1 MAG: 50S ribosomal protein L25, large subunit ribosomal protein L25 [candidate division WS6 bacterium GW2011_GWC1_33_20]KKP44251.1 MAG: 50S ribosomal protein L25, large subunit ribosomal protein L25 [candidate division WS6 bacterium GW2011_GWF1_33_233]KKP54602.1 MAG: 50S ribosomal protein L25, large subunit ribosomal protein L25 [candidate division WS6 bacterium 